MNSDQLLKATVQEVRQLAHDAVVTLQALDDLLIDIGQGEDEDQQAIHDEVKEALNAAEDLKASVDVWRLDISEWLPEQDDGGGIGVAAE